jgi:hypothetical protein
VRASDFIEPERVVSALCKQSYAGTPGLPHPPPFAIPSRHPRRSWQLTAAGAAAGESFQADATSYDALYYKHYYAQQEEEQQQEEQKEVEQKEEEKPAPVLPPAKYGNIVVGVPLKKTHPYQRHIGTNKVANFN